MGLRTGQPRDHLPVRWDSRTNAGTPAHFMGLPETQDLESHPKARMTEALEESIPWQSSWSGISMRRDSSGVSPKPGSAPWGF